MVIEKDQAPVQSSTLNVVDKRFIDGQEITSVSWAVNPTTARQVKVNPVTALPPGTRVHDPDDPHDGHATFQDAKEELDHKTASSAEKVPAGQGIQVRQPTQEPQFKQTPPSDSFSITAVLKPN